ncbi:hypothetical protein HA402_008880 [Bradysia odoriphaga]|nr:hypothetical protein HA402_008880 [Bradysia odoriphaga]
MTATNSLNFGNIMADSRLIYEEYFKHNGYADKIALRDEMIRTDDGPISAIRATDVSGQNGLAVITSISNNFVQLAFSSDGFGRGFDFRVEIYRNVDNDEPDDHVISKKCWNCFK